LQYSILPIRARVRHRTGEHNPCRVWIRTNINQGHRIRRQIIDQVEKGQSYSTDFYDIPAVFNNQTGEYEVDILLHEVGYFEFKVRAESARRRQPWVEWARGPNTGISVTPQPFGRDNSIYCAFIRQFGEQKSAASLKDSAWDETVEKLQEQGACVIPPGGNFDNFIKELPFIVQTMGMKIIHLLPINPVPTTYGRMGQFGSPYATTHYLGIEHSYATFSRHKTIEGQFIDLTSTIHGLGAKVFLDMVINHSGWAAAIHFTHPHWKVVDKNNKIVSPGAWGTVWEDLVELDYRHKDLWQYMADVFLVWCRRGIDGFRLDAGYMVPLEVWRYIISKVREEFPNTLFLLEGLGGPWETTEKLLTQGQMNWAYSELFQNYSKEQIARYLNYAQEVSSGKGVLVNYAETHDNDRLAKKGKTYTRMRLYLNAFTAFAGAWGFTNGVEWLATEKINVHRNTGLNWGSEENLVSEIAQINEILSSNRAFWGRDNLKIVDLPQEDLFAFTRTARDQSNSILCVINLNCEESRELNLDFDALGLAELAGVGAPMRNLFTGEQAHPADGHRLDATMKPGQCLLYQLNWSSEKAAVRIPAVYQVDYDKITLIYRILLDRYKAHEVSRIDQERLLPNINDFRKFIALVNTVSLEELKACEFPAALESITPEQVSHYSDIWTLHDSSREFILPGDKWLVVHTFVPCTAYFTTKSKRLSMESIPSEDKVGHFSFFPPQPENRVAQLTFNWKLERENMIQRQWQNAEYPVRSIPAGDVHRQATKVYPIAQDKRQLQQSHAKILLTNGIGGAAQIPAMPGEINSKYDTLLSLAVDPHYPAERTSLVKMVKETLQIDHRHFDLDESFFTRFTRYPQPTWEFAYEDGEYTIRLERSIAMAHGENSVSIRYKLLEANTHVKLFCKFYVECRNLHEPMQPDEARRWHYADALGSLPKWPGFTFSPDPDLRLTVAAREGEYISQPHWIYDLKLTEDAQRGLCSHGNVFAPGVFDFELSTRKVQVIAMTADPEPLERVSFLKNEADENKRTKRLLSRLPSVESQKDPILKLLIPALDAFIVKTPEGWILTAGYPWLGRKTVDLLRCVPGLLHVGRTEVARDVILQTAATENRGMLNDWLDRSDSGQSSTEAVLRLILAARDYQEWNEESDFLEQNVDSSRSLREVLANIFSHLIQIDVQGPCCDPDTGLLYSPPGCSWMDTTAPQSSPRGGYAVELQALWYQALASVVTSCPEKAAEAELIRKKVATHFSRLFWDDQRGHLADVLGLRSFDKPEEATFDTAIRFNQLAAIDAGLVTAEQAKRIVAMTAAKLLLPGALRSLSEDPLSVPLEIMDTHGDFLADPYLPYQGHCEGDEIQRRLAYHNGTAWLFAYPAFVEAHARAYGNSPEAINQALAYFEATWPQFTRGGIGALGEMADANYPHTPRGCYAHAPAVTETLRVYLNLKYASPANRNANKVTAHNTSPK
jgi:predicted glycogen debranching enzyme